MKRSGSVRARTLWALLTVALMAGLLVAGAGAIGSTVKRVHVAYDGTQANGEAELPVVSTDGRWVAFASSSSNLVTGDTNAAYDIYVRDTQSGETTLVSQAWDAPGTAVGALNFVDMTPDGHYVSFCSGATNLVPNDTNGQYDVFVRDLVSGETMRASTTSTGEEANYWSNNGNISDDGRYVAFFSQASNLAPEGMVTTQNVFRKDLVSGETTLVSIGYDGSPANWFCFYPNISGDGNKVAFLSYATNMVPGDTSTTETDLFVRDLTTGVTERVNATPAGGQSAGAMVLNYFDMDYSGQHVAFMCRASDLVSQPVGPNDQVYVRDTVSDETTIVSVAADGGAADDSAIYPSVSADGRYVQFATAATNIVDGHLYAHSDIFRRDLQTGVTELVSLNENGEQLNGYTGQNSINSDGTICSFATRATNVLAPDTNGQSDIFTRAILPPDSLAPTVSSDAQPSYARTALVTITATDAPGGSGIASIGYRFDGAATQTVGSEMATISAGRGPHTLSFWAEDVAGNRSATHEATFTVAGVVTRIAGGDRYGTAAEIARAGWDPAGTKAWPNVKHIIIANGEPGKEPDPLTAAGLAGAYDAPVLTTQANKLPAITKTIITQIALKNPGVKIHLVGGTSVVPDARWTEIRKVPGVSQTKDRVWGSDRYATSVAIANRIVSLKGSEISGVILIAGDNPAAFYDALAASPIAYAKTMPMLSVQKGAIPTSVSTALKSAALKDKPRYVASSSTYIGTTAAAGGTRLATSYNRYTAATQIAGYATDPGRAWMSMGDTALASTLPDALTGGALLGKLGGVMLFTDSSSAIQTTSKSYLDGRSLSITDGWVIGGTAVLPPAQETSYRNLLK